MKLNINKLKKLLKKRKIDVGLIINSRLNDPSFFYFADVIPEHAFMFVSSKFPTRIYCSALECEQKKKQSSIKNFKELNKKAIDNIKLLIKKHKIKKIGLNFSYVTVSEHKRLKKLFSGIKIVDLSQDLKQLRAIKTKKEILLYKQASKLTETVWAKTINAIKKHKLKTELQVKEFIEAEIEKDGYKTSFPLIVASGKNAAIPHYSPRQNKLKGFCVVDFGINYNGYCTDITRTFFVGKSTKKEIELYNLVNNAKNYASTLITPGKRTAFVTKKTRQALGKYEKYFTHGLGHGIGLEIHEFPNLKTEAKDKFYPGMIFTIEPGIYIKNKLGIRIEDDYLLGEKGLIQLTKAPKDLVVINR